MFGYVQGDLEVPAGLQYKFSNSRLFLKISTLVELILGIIWEIKLLKTTYWSNLNEC